MCIDKIIDIMLCTHVNIETVVATNDIYMLIFSPPSAPFFITTVNGHAQIIWYLFYVRCPS